MHKFFFDIEQKFEREGRGSAVDVDIFANAAMIPPPGGWYSARTGAEELNVTMEELQEMTEEEKQALEAAKADDPKTVRLQQLEELLRRFFLNFK